MKYAANFKDKVVRRESRNRYYYAWRVVVNLPNGSYSSVGFSESFQESARAVDIMKRNMPRDGILISEEIVDV